MSIDASVLKFIKPDWPAAANIHAFSTTRCGGVSQGTFAYLNLALHVEDNAAHVLANRQQLKSQLKLPAEPVWLDQVHGRQVINAADNNSTLPQADASFSYQANNVCIVMTADCLPVLICNKKADKVAAAHAGWKGLVDGVIESTISSLNEPVEQLLVWLGPAIGPQAFEVGREVREAFVNDLPESEAAFTLNHPEHYLADMYQLARLRLQQMGINAIYGGDYCTFTDSNNFYSYRRDGKTGRQASLIWFD